MVQGSSIGCPFLIHSDMANETSPLLSTATTGAASRAYTSHDENGHNNSPNLDPEPSSIGPKKTNMALASVVIPMAIGMFLVSMDQTIIVSSYAAIGSELEQLQNTSWIATGYMLTLTSFQPLYGKLSDIFGRKACLLFAYSIFALGSLLCGLSRNMTELIIARAFAGIGGGGMSTIVSIIMSDVVPLRSRGTWQGILNIVFAVGSGTGGPLGGFLTDSIGWRWTFLIQVPATILAILTVSLALDLPKTSTSDSDFRAKLGRLDFAGAIALVFTVFFLLFGLDRGGNISWSDTLTISSLFAFAVLFILFGVIEMKLASEPFAPKRIIINRSLIASYLVNFFGMGAMLSMVFHVSLYFQAVRGQSASETGLWLLPVIGGTVVGSLGGGLIMQATGKYYFLTLGAYVTFFAGSIIATLMTGIVLQSSTGIAIGFILAGLGNGSGVTTSLVSLIANAGPEDQAIATAVSFLFRSLGSVLGLSVGSALVQGTLRSSLRLKLSGQDVEELVRRVRESLSYLEELDPTTRAIVRGSYEHAVHITLYFIMALAACAAISAVFIKEKSLAPRV